VAASFRHHTFVQRIACFLSALKRVPHRTVTARFVPVDLRPRQRSGRPHVLRSGRPGRSRVAPGAVLFFHAPQSHAQL